MLPELKALQANTEKTQINDDESQHKSGDPVQEGMTPEIPDKGNFGNQINPFRNADEKQEERFASDVKNLIPVNFRSASGDETNRPVDIKKETGEGCKSDREGRHGSCKRG